MELKSVWVQCMNKAVCTGTFPVRTPVESCVLPVEAGDNTEIARHASKPSLWSDFKLLTIH